jgi:HEAT repeat protein
LEAEHTSVETTCDILRVIGEIKSPQWNAPLTKVLTRFISHEHPKLREQAIHTLYQIKGPEGEGIFLSSLDDSNLDVQKRTVWCLGMIKSAKGVEKMMGILKHISATPSPKLDQLETQIYHAFGTSGNLTIEGKTLEEFLVNVVEQRGIRRWFGLFEKNALTDAALGAICDALGKIGTKESMKTLTHLEKSREGPWVQKVKEAIKKIEERTKL